MGNKSSKDKEIDNQGSTGQFGDLSNHMNRALELYATSKAISNAIEHETTQAKNLLERVLAIEKMARELIRAAGIEHIHISKKKNLKSNKRKMHDSEVIVEGLQSASIANTNLGFAGIELAKLLMQNYELDLVERLAKIVKSNYQERAIQDEIILTQKVLYRLRIIEAIKEDDADFAYHYYFLLVNTDADAGDYLGISDTILFLFAEKSSEIANFLIISR
nr:hypothetical protein [Chloroflexota bacterium]